MRQAARLSPEGRKQSSLQMHPGDLHHPKGTGSCWPSSPSPLGSQLPPAPPRHVTFEDKVMSLGRAPRRFPTAEERQKLGFRSGPPRLSPQPRAVPDYVLKYPAIRSPQQREGYKGVFQDQLAEYMDLLQELRAVWQRLGKLQEQSSSRGQGLAFLEKQRRCEYLKKKLTHIKARIQEYDRSSSTSYF